MNRLSEFIKRERLYILLLVFVMLVSALVAISSEHSKSKASANARVEEKNTTQDMQAKRMQTEKVLKENKPLAAIFTIASLLIMLVLLLGLVIEGILIAKRLSGRPIDIHTYRLGAVKWGLLDVARATILFLFFGYMLIMIESFLAKTFPVIKNDDVRMVFNSSILDTLIIVFILFFAIQEHKESLRSLGLTCQNFFHNVFYGIVGYIAILPVLFLVLLLTTLVTSFFKYASKEQVMVDLFMKHNNPTFLIYTSLFAAIAGPIVEELFFRGFMYSAVKKYVGIFPSIFITAALFAALHAHAVGFLPIMVLGILLAYLYEKTGTLVSSITVHVMHNFSMVLLVFLAKSMKGF